MAEQRLIDAKALWKNVDKLPSVLDANNGWLVKKTSVLAKIEDATVVQPKPVVHGRWETNSDRPDSLICSVCKCGFDMWKHDPHNYCPNCGAQMDEKEG